MWDEIVFNVLIKGGNNKITYPCDNCGVQKEYPCKYLVLHQIIRHHGQGVEGSLTEQVLVKPNFPEIIQCGQCKGIYRISYNETIFEDIRDSSINLSTGEVVKQPEVIPSYSKDRLQQDLETFVDSVHVELIGNLS